MARYHTGKLAILLTSALALGACDDGGKFANPFQKKPSAQAAEGEVTASTSTRLVERDVEVPEVFQVADKGLWDGRPSLGGVWVAHDDAPNPERVIIRNEANGKFVIGALFKRETSNPGPAVQVSSDAASALGMLAGAPAQLNITALRREEVPIADESASDGPILDAAEPIEAQTLDGDPIASAAAAIDRVDSSVISPPAAATPAAAAAKPAAPKSASRLDKPYIQLGIFSVKANADNTAEMMRKAGVVPTVDAGNSSGKDFYRVIVGPAATASDRAALLKKVKGLGFNDAYAVTD